MMHTESHSRSALSMRCVLKITVLPRALSSTMVSFSACALIGIEAGERLVEDDEVGIVDERADELHLLLHAARELVDLGEPPVLLGRLEVEALHPVLDALVRVLAGHALELGEELQHPADLHLLVEAALLGQVADAVGDAGRSRCGLPNSEMEPLSGTMMLRIMRIVVVLPAPLGPSRP